MDYIADLIFSSTLFTGIFIFLLPCLGIFLATRKPFKNRIILIFYRIFCCLMPFGIFAIPTFAHYGFADSFTTMGIGKSVIILLDKYERLENYDLVCRMHVLDKKTGKKLYRKYLGNNSHILALRGDTVLMEIENGFKLIAAKDFTIIKEFNSKTLPLFYSQLKDGIDSLNAYPNCSFPDNNYCISVNGMNGKAYSLFPFENKIIEGEYSYPNQSDSAHKKLILTKKKILIHDTIHQNESFSMELKSISHPQIFSLYKNDTISIGKEYLLGEFVDFDTVSKNITIKYYSTTQHEKFLLVQLNKSLQENWKFEQSRFGLTDYYASTTPFNVHATEGNRFYFNCGGFVACVNQLNGKIIWTSRL